MNILPIGSVVLLNGGTKKVMITGYYAKDIDVEDTSIIYDYTGVLFPEGLLGTNENILFNQNQINKLFFTGFINEETNNYLSTLKKIKENFDNNNQ